MRKFTVERLQEIADHVASYEPGSAEDSRPVELQRMEQSFAPPTGPYYRFLYEIAREFKPKLSVELGVKNGTGSMHLAMGYGKAMVIGIDIDPKPIAAAAWMQRNLKIIIGGTIKSAPLVAAHGAPNLVFVDSRHVSGHIRGELDAYRKIVAPGALFLFDDCWPDSPPRRIEATRDLRGFFRPFREQGLVLVNHLHPGAGFGFLLTGEPEEDAVVVEEGDA